MYGVEYTKMEQKNKHLQTGIKKVKFNQKQVDVLQCNEIKVSNPKTTLENIPWGQRYNGIRLLFIFIACFFQKVVLNVFTMLYSDSPQKFIFSFLLNL